VLQGVGQCRHCGYASYGKRLSPSARQGKLRAYAYYRCLGTDAYRFGGERVCHKTQVRTDLLELAVWREVCALLAHPERVAAEYQRRLRPDGRGRRDARTALEAQLGKLRQGMARLIDRDTEGLIEKHEVEPRLARLRHRLADVEMPCHQLADALALHTALRLMMGRLEEFTAQLHQGLDHLAWTRKRELIRTLVKRVELASDQVHVVFRVAPRPGEIRLEKKRLHLCRKSKRPPRRRPLRRRLEAVARQRSGFPVPVDALQHPSIPDLLLDPAPQLVVIPPIKELLEVQLYPPAIACLQMPLGLGNGLVGRTPWAKAVAPVGEGPIPCRLEHLP
jgi:site-specific DNA recombinase